MCLIGGFVTPTASIMNPRLKLTPAFDMEIKSHTPESGATSIRVGEKLELWCNVDRYWEWCNFVHKPSARFCDFYGRRTGLFHGNVTVNDCSSFEGRFEYLGDYDKFKCGIRLLNITRVESGLWMCYLRSLEGIHLAKMAFQVNVMAEDTIEVTSLVVGTVVGVVILTVGTIVACFACINIFKKSTRKVKIL